MKMSRFTRGETRIHPQDPFVLPARARPDLCLPRAGLEGGAADPVDRQSARGREPHVALGRSVSPSRSAYRDRTGTSTQKSSGRFCRRRGRESPAAPRERGLSPFAGDSGSQAARILFPSGSRRRDGVDQTLETGAQRRRLVERWVRNAPDPTFPPTRSYLKR